MLFPVEELLCDESLDVATQPTNTAADKSDNPIFFYHNYYTYSVKKMLGV